MENLSGMDSWFGNAFGVPGSHHYILGSYHCHTVGAAADTAAGAALNPDQAASFHCLDFSSGLKAC